MVGPRAVWDRGCGGEKAGSQPEPTGREPFWGLLLCTHLRGEHPGGCGRRVPAVLEASVGAVGADRHRWKIRLVTQEPGELALAPDPTLLQTLAASLGSLRGAGEGTGCVTWGRWEGRGQGSRPREARRPEHCPEANGQRLPSLFQGVTPLMGGGRLHSVLRHWGPGIS